MRTSLDFLVADRKRTIGWKFAATMGTALGFLAAASVARAEDDLATLVQKARDGFQPVTADQLAAARADLTQRMGELERFVAPSTANGKKWLKFLKWDGLNSVLAAEGAPDLAALDATLGRLHRNENGLELSRFRAVAAALQRYRDLAAVAQWTDPVAIYGQQLDGLAAALDLYRQDPTAENEVALRNQLTILRAVGQAPELVAAVRRQFDRPNAFVDVSADLLAAAAEPIDRSERITDNILGTHIVGDAHTTGSVAIATLAADDAAVLKLTSNGRSVTQNVGYNGPAVIHSTGYTDFVASKRVELTDQEFSSSPAHADASNHTEIHSIGKRGGGLGSRLVSNIGWQRAREQKHRADAIAADHAEDRIERQFNNEVAQKLREARQRYENEYRRPLERRGDAPHGVRFASSPAGVSLTVTQAGHSQLAAVTDPPAQPAGHDMTMRLHESAVNNYTGTMMGGATASQTDPGQDTKFDVKMPKWIEDLWKERKTQGTAAAATEGFKPWSLKLRPTRPISVDFADGKVKLTLHVERLQSGASEPFINWDVWGVYSPELKDGGIVLRREGDLDAMPANLRGELGSRRAAQRNNLIKEFNARSAQGHGLPAAIEFPELKPEGPLADAGPLQLKELQSDDGWLVLAWDRASK